MRKLVLMFFVVTTFLSAPAFADTVVGTIGGGLFGFAGTVQPEGVYIGFGASNTSQPTAFLFSNVGLIPISNTTQVFTISVANDPAFAEVASALSTGTADFSWESCYEPGDTSLQNGFPGPGVWPPACLGQGGTQPRDGWTGSTITSIQLSVAPFDFVPVNIVREGVFYQVETPGLPGTFPLISITAYGTPGPPIPEPEPDTTSFTLVGMGLLGSTMVMKGVAAIR